MTGTEETRTGGVGAESGVVERLTEGGGSTVVSGLGRGRTFPTLGFLLTIVSLKQR